MSTHEPGDPVAAPGDPAAPGLAAPGLPPLLQRLWEEPARPRRGPKAALSRDRITEAAIEIAGAEGLAAVSMARVGEALGFTSMALYRHVSGKDELLALMADAAGSMPADRVPDPRQEPVDWRTGLERWTRAQIEMIIERPWYLDLPLASSPPGPNRMAWLERGFALLEPTRLSTEEKLAVLGMLAEHVLGQARVHIETIRASVAGGGDPYAEFEGLLALLVDPERHPALHRAVHDEGTTDPDPQFDDIGFAIGVVLDGIAAFVERRRTERGRG